MRLGLGPPGLIRLAMLAGLGLSMLLTACASTGSQASDSTTEEKRWGQCDRSRIVNVTLLCYQR
jgi:recombinational DNA repair protein (RecF pathway)